jgi:3-isopropylmalate/(R)-2-methylmalate dehydratase large subunit
MTEVKMAAPGRSVLDKTWDQHAVAELGDGTSLLHVDRVLLHERTPSSSAGARSPR